MLLDWLVTRDLFGYNVELEPLPRRLKIFGAKRNRVTLARGIALVAPPWELSYWQVSVIPAASPPRVTGLFIKSASKTDPPLRG